MRCTVIVALVVWTALMIGGGTEAVGAQNEATEAASHPLVGSWMVEVGIQGQPPQ